MKDVSGCLLSIIDEFNKYNTKIVSLEDEKQIYDNNVQLLKVNRDKLLNDKEKIHEKLEKKYTYIKKVVNELRHENAHMNADILRLEEENKTYSEIVELLTLELTDSKKGDKLKPADARSLYMRIHGLEAELKESKNNYLNLVKVEEEKDEFKKQYIKISEDMIFQNSQYQTLHKQYVELQKHNNNGHSKAKDLEYEIQGLNKLYKHTLHEKVILQKKIEDIYIENYKSINETQNMFSVNNDTAVNEDDFIDIDSLINGISPSEKMKDKLLA